MSGRKDERLLALREAVAETLPGLTTVPDRNQNLKGSMNALVTTGKARLFCELMFYGHTVRDACAIMKIGEDSAYHYVKTPHYQYLKAEVDGELTLKTSEVLLKIARNAVIEAIKDARETMKTAKNGFLRQRIREWMFELYEKLDKMQPGGQKSLLTEVFKQIETRKIDANTTIRRERTLVRPADEAGGRGIDGPERVAGGEDRAEGVEEVDGGASGGGIHPEADIIDAEPGDVGQSLQPGVEDGGERAGQ